MKESIKKQPLLDNNDVAVTSLGLGVILMVNFIQMINGQMRHIEPFLHQGYQGAEVLNGILVTGVILAICAIAIALYLAYDVWQDSRPLKSVIY